VQHFSVVFAAFVIAGLSSNGLAANDLPSAWLKAWREPDVELRPLQIVHGLPPDQATPAAMTQLKDLGLGGIVCNVSFDDYLKSERHWETLTGAVGACKKVGLRVWLYDELGYPSGAAGGLVLRKVPQAEALALTYDPTRSDPFALRPAYEHTHASNNFCAARRYPNLIDERAVACFIETTHEAYYRRLTPFFGTTIKAVFTDEPSLMAVNIGPLPDEVRTKVRVQDPLDPNVVPLPSVPWVADLPQLYQQRYGQDLMAIRKSLFEGDSDADRQVRRRFWALISDLMARRYFGRIQRWAQAHGVASSGHSLWEETPLHHVPLEGNGLKALCRMDIPGLDMLSSNPEAAIHTGWLTASLPASAALVTGSRRVMTEVSDFSETMAQKGPAPVADMCATAAWQAAFGVTEFALYYNRGERSPADYRSYCTFVGRLNALLREARLAPRVLLYYPIADIWADYRPVAQKLVLSSQPKSLQETVSAFMGLGQRLTRAQISFVLADHEVLSAASVQKGSLCVAGRPFTTLILPCGVELPALAQEKVEELHAAGGLVLRDVTAQELDVQALTSTHDCGLPRDANERLVVGRFVREGRRMVVVVNVGTARYDGGLTAGNPGSWHVADPHAGSVERARATGTGDVAISLPPRGARILIGPIPARPGGMAH
jgi:hypothetical protein